MTTSTSPTLLDWIMKLLGDPDARAEFTSDPDGYATRYGFPNLSSGDVHDALCLAVDCAPAHADKEFHLPSPSRDHDDDHDHNHHGGGGSHYLKHYINNYETVVHRETIIDNSVHQKIDTDGGDFDQHLDMDPVVASGDGAVATHGDISDSTITPGNGNVIGENLHAVTGDDNTTRSAPGRRTRLTWATASSAPAGRCPSAATPSAATRRVTPAPTSATPATEPPRSTPPARTGTPTATPTSTRRTPASTAATRTPHARTATIR